TAPGNESLDVALHDGTYDSAMIAIQGPKAHEILTGLPVIVGGTGQNGLDEMRYYHCAPCEFAGGRRGMVSRTGYTGEDGFEIICDPGDAQRLWDTIVDRGKALGGSACGLGARDTLRLEAAMPLYGHELSEAINPLQAGLNWAVKFDKPDFLGKAALQRRK